MTVPARHQGSSQDAGFTLVELLVVLAILGLVAILAATSLPASRRQAPNLDLRLQAIRMAAGLKAARAAAIHRGQEMAFVFTARDNAWSIDTIEAPKRLPPDVTLKLETARSPCARMARAGWYSSRTEAPRAGG